MNTPFVNGLDLAMFAHFFPFIMVALAIVFLMIAKMLRINLITSFVVAMLLLAGAWFAGFAETTSSSFGFASDSIGQLGLKILLPAVMIICLMILRKTATTGKKIEALLLVLISCLGAMVTLVSYNWMLFFIGLQCLSLPLYGLLAFDPDDQFSLASSARYLLLSFVAMGIMLFGILLLYAATGSMDLAEQGVKIRELMLSGSGVVGLGLIFIFIGMAFKVSLFPFHAWAPEVYSGARLFVISYLVVVVKSVVIIFLMRTAFLLIGTDNIALNGIIAGMAMLSMWVGNGMMLRETNLIRLLAFLSIGHLGALMIPILAHNNLAIDAIFLDIIAFGLSMLLIFAALRGLRSRELRLDDLRGLYHRHPWASITLAIALISLTGFPLTAGFIGKFAIFQAGVAASLWQLIFHFVLSGIIGLAVIAKIVASLWQKSSASTTAQIAKTPVLSELMLCAAVAIVMMGIFPEPWIAWVKFYTASAGF